MKQRDKVSVIIPCYNAEKTISLCVRSVLNQTHSNLEVIIVDDGSTDHSVSLIEQLQQESKQAVKIELYRQQNAGPSAARNVGIRRASGDFMAFLDADDHWLADKLKKQLEVFSLFPAAAMVGGPVGLIRNMPKLITPIPFKQLLFSNYFATSSVLIVTSIIKDIGFNETMKYSEDYRTWLLVAYQYPCYYLDEVLTKQVALHRNVNPTNLSSRLWKMEKGELSNYIYLFQRKYISWFSLLSTVGYSFAKYILRVLVKVSKK